MFRKNRTKLATAVILALLLTVAVASVAASHHEPINPPPPAPPTDPTPVPVTPAPPGGGSGNPPPPPTTTPAPPTATPAPPGNGGDNGGGMQAPAWPPPGLIVTHAATQVQLAPVGDGLHVYLIGSDGTGHSGPYIPAFSSLAQQHAGATALWSGTNPGTGKSVTITYLPAENKLRISTYYPDTQYDVNKPYVFTVDASHKVVHEQW